MGEPSHNDIAETPLDGALPLGRKEVISGFSALSRTFDAGQVNFFANHPEIRPELDGAAPLDLAPAMHDANVFLFGEHGGIVFSWTAPRTYEAHVVLTRAGRGRWGFNAAREAVAAMVAAGARHLWCRVRPERRDVAIFAALAGFRECGELRSDDTVWRLFEWRLECLSR